MSFNSTTFSACLFKLAEPKNLSKQEMIEALEKFKIKPINLGDETEESSGWCNELLDPEIIDLPNQGDFFKLCFRKDNKKVPAKYLKKEFERRLEGLMLGKEEKAQLKEDTKLDLLKNCVPNISSADILWDTERNVIWFLSPNKALADAFLLKFQDTFDVTLLKLGADNFTTKELNLDDTPNYQFIKWLCQQAIDPENKRVHLNDQVQIVMEDHEINAKTKGSMESLPGFKSDGNLIKGCSFVMFSDKFEFEFKINGEDFVISNIKLPKPEDKAADADEFWELRIERFDAFKAFIYDRLEKFAGCSND